MKKSIILLCCAAALIVCALLLPNQAGQHRAPEKIPVSSENNTLNYSTSNTTSSQESTSAAEVLASGSDVYIVREYEGHIAVYRNDETTPFREYNTDVTILPQADRAALKQGKVLHSMAEVEKLMEDYDG